MKAVVVDTNVPIVANARAEEEEACVLACTRALRTATSEGLVVIDDRMIILREYLQKKRLSLSGEPGVGDAFIKWIFDHEWDTTRCERVSITPIPGTDGDCEEFPRDPALAAFDRGDRKFVAVALGSAHHPTILNAVDSRSWPVYREHLARHGVQVECLCPHLMKG